MSDGKDPWGTSIPPGLQPTAVPGHPGQQPGQPAPMPMAPGVSPSLSPAAPPPRTTSSPSMPAWTGHGNVSQPPMPMPPGVAPSLSPAGAPHPPRQPPAQPPHHQQAPPPHHPPASPPPAPSPAQGVPSPAAPPAAPATGTSGALDDVPILRALSPVLKKQLEGQLTEQAFNKNDIIFREGDAGDGMYIVKQGMVSVFLTDKTIGLSVDLATLGRGEAFGEMALITGEPRSATVKALAEDTRVLLLNRNVFFKLVQAVPQVGLSIAGTLAQRLEGINRTQGVAFGSLAGRELSDEARALVPMSVIRQHQIVPISLTGGVCMLATPDPANKLAVDAVRRMVRGTEIQLMAVSKADFDRFLEAQFGTLPTDMAVQGRKRDYGMMARQAKYYGATEKGDEARAQAQAASQDVVDLFSRIVAEGTERGASDIHIEPEKKGVQVRYRVDGQLVYRAGEIPLSAHNPLMSRMKILAGLDIAERRLPQDGRISVAFGDKTYDLRVSTLATSYGEKGTMRILDASKLQSDLGQLILAEKVNQVVRRLIYRPTGMFLVTGPTGSGKSSTLYGSLLERRNPALNICTIEDPIEFDVDGINQIQVNETAGLGFSDIMRTLMRQDPDIILVGETRDKATAHLCCNAALTGHLVMTSFHTNDAATAIQRLRTMGVEPFMVADSLLGVINQRLIRRICGTCKEEAQVSDVIRRNLERANVKLDDSATFYKGRGCNQCGGEGFRGRVGIYELIVASTAVREAISRAADAVDIRLAAGDGSHVPLGRYGSYLLAEGLTVPSEVLRVVPKE